MSGRAYGSYRLLLALLVISIFLNYIDRSNLSLAAPIMQREFGLSPTALGKLLGAFFWTYALCQLFGISGWLADRFHVGRVLAGGLFLWSAATMATGAVSGLGAMFAIRLLVGAGESVAYPCYCRIFATAIPPERRGVANALLDAGSKLGPGLGTLVGGVLLARAGWRAFFVALGAASLLWLIPWLRTIGRLLPAEQHGRVADRGPSVARILRCGSAWGTFFGLFCANYFWFFLLTWLPTYLVNGRGFGMDRMVTISSAAFLTIASGTMLAGWLSDRWIAAGGSLTRVRKTFVAGGLAGSAVILPVAFVHGEAACVAFLLLACVSFGFFSSNHWAITQTVAGPLAAGRWTSLENGVGNLAGVAAAWLTGISVDRTHSYVAAFAVASAVAVAGAAIWVFGVDRVEEVKW